MIGHYSRHGADPAGGRFIEAPAALRFQRYQFRHVAGQLRLPSYRSELRVAAPGTIDECHRRIKELARKMYRRNGAVDEEDLVQIGETTLLEGLHDLRRRGIRPRQPALRAILQASQSAMFHAVDHRLVQLEWPAISDGRERDGDEGDKEPVICEWLGASCNITVARLGTRWEFVPDCSESWGVPLPPGSCQPRPTPLCAWPHHLPLVPFGRALPDLR